MQRNQCQFGSSATRDIALGDGVSPRIKANADLVDKFSKAEAAETAKPEEGVKGCFKVHLVKEVYFKKGEKNEWMLYFALQRENKSTVIRGTAFANSCLHCGLSPKFRDL